MIMKNLIIIFFVFASACAGASLSQKEMDYFCEIALNNEFTSGDNGQISKWKQDIKIKVHEESPIQQEDWNNLNKVIAELNVLVGDSIDISIVNSGENVEFYFTDRLGLKAHGGRIAGSTNVFGNPFNKAIIAVDIFFGKNNNGTRRRSITNHIVREEIVQTLGLLADSNAHPDSIFFKGYSETQGFSDLDKRIVQLLYSDNIKLGMKREEVIESLGVANVPPPQGAPPSVIPSPYVDPNKGLREELEALKSVLKGKDVLIASLEAQKQERDLDLEEFQYKNTGLQEAVDALQSQVLTPHTNEWYFEPDHGWLWTNAETFPYIYSSQAQAWLHYEIGSSPRLFFNYKSQKWEEWK